MRVSLLLIALLWIGVMWALFSQQPVGGRAVPDRLSLSNKSPYSYGSPRSLVQLVGRESEAVLRNPDQVSFYRIRQPDSIGVRGPKLTPYENVQLVAGPFRVERRWSAEFVALLDSLEASGFQSMAKNCMTNPGVLLRFRSGEITVDVKICLDCDEISFGAPVGDTRSVREDIDSIHPQMVKLLQELDPKLKSDG